MREECAINAMGTCMYENEVEIQSSISVGFTATYNHSEIELAISSNTAILIILSPFLPSDRRKIRVDSRVRLSSNYSSCGK